MERQMSAMPSTLFPAAVTRRPGKITRRLFRTSARDIAHYFARRAALKRLGELNDRELADIGITRGEIEVAVYGVTRPDQARTSGRRSWS